MDENNVDIDSIKTDFDTRIKNIKSKLKFNDAVKFENNIINNYSPKLLYDFSVDSLLIDIILLLTIVMKLNDFKIVNLELYNMHIKIIIFSVAIISILFNTVQYFYYKKIYVISDRFITMLNFIFSCYKLTIILN